MPPQRKHLALYALAAVAIAGLATAYFIIDPEQTRFAPRCLFLSLTGWKCPGCGSQRMIHALLHGKVADAWQYNPFFVASIPILIFLIWLEFNRKSRPKLYAAIYAPRNIIIATAVIIMWGIARNIFSI